MYMTDASSVMIFVMNQVISLSREMTKASSSGYVMSSTEEFWQMKINFSEKYLLIQTWKMPHKIYVSF